MIVALGPASEDVARRLVALLPEAQLHSLKGRCADADVTFDATGKHLRSLFQVGSPIVGVCAAGILVRAIAPLIKDKSEEPPVVAVSSDGSAAVPILGGHKGANALARTIADEFGGTAAITTAGEARLGVALDEPPTGWTVRNEEAVKPIAAALLANEPVALVAEAGDADWLRKECAHFSEQAPLTVRLTAREVSGSRQELVIHPAVLAVGIGCERGVAETELVRLTRETLAQNGLAAAAIACVVSLDIKADEPAVHAVAADLDVPARFFDAQVLEAQTPRLANPSRKVFEEVGCHGVAEAAALAAAGPRSALVVPKTRSSRATCAIAQAPEPIEVRSVGRPRGRLFLVGIGPGGEPWRSFEASAAIAAADDLVGYGAYLDLLGPQVAGKQRHEFSLGEEVLRAQTSLDLAAEGRTVALVSSGDAGIYAMATIVFGQLEREGRADWDRVDVSVIPGISALQAAAARAGAPLGQDFCAISLSDVLTPWSVIKARLEAAASGDFVVALYNPVSKRRRQGLTRARQILLEHRSKETPIIIAKNLGRAREQVRTMALGALSPDDADMRTLVLVGNSCTRQFVAGSRSWVYTPRKMPA